MWSTVLTIIYKNINNSCRGHHMSEFYEQGKYIPLHKCSKVFCHLLFVEPKCYHLLVESTELILASVAEMLDLSYKKQVGKAEHYSDLSIMIVRPKL